MDRENKPGGVLTLRRVVVTKLLIKEEVRRIIMQVSIIMMLGHLTMRMVRESPRRKLGIEVEIGANQEGKNTVSPMVLVKEPVRLFMRLNLQSHHLARECLMEPGDSQWGVVGL
ncbi:hypothetical protein GBA52_012576 [Prunus armeniaca]|nr:hypothetical protein GBA52_012576 [Prunus armeniaca]